MIPSVKSRMEEHVDDRLGKTRSDNAFTHGENVRVIVTAAVFRRERVMTKSGTDAVNFISCNPDTDTRPADENASVEGSPLRHEPLFPQ